MTLAYTDDLAHPADRLFVRAEHHAGFYVIPLNGNTEKQLTLRMAMGKPVPTASYSNEMVHLLLAVVDQNGTTSGWTPLTLEAYLTAAGE